LYPFARRLLAIRKFTKYKEKLKTHHSIQTLFNLRTNSSGMGITKNKFEATKKPRTNNSKITRHNIRTE